MRKTGAASGLQWLIEETNSDGLFSPRTCETSYRTITLLPTCARGGATGASASVQVPSVGPRTSKPSVEATSRPSCRTW